MTTLIIMLLSVLSPDGRLQLSFDLDAGRPTYAITYDGKQMLDPSPLGFKSDAGDFTQQLTVAEQAVSDYSDSYKLDRSKVAEVNYVARQLAVTLRNSEGKEMAIRFRVSNNDVALRYEISDFRGKKKSIRIDDEATGFRLPAQTTTFICPQSDAMIGWKRSKPSYEEEYSYDAPMTEKSKYGHGYTFPCLFHTPDGWVLISETGVDSRYCASRLSDYTDGVYKVEFPMPEENNGNGTVAPAFALPGATPWRTITVGTTLKPIVETTAPWDNVQPRYTTTHKYTYGKSGWSWILWQDDSANWDDQVQYIDMAAQLGWPYVLIDSGWDHLIGYARMASLVEYARSKGVEIFLWYSSSGYWNDIVQSPINVMPGPIQRKSLMRWMQSIGVKGIKVDFFGGDKQETMRLYESILSDADDAGLMVIFHGCTLPRGWERMCPNYVGSEAVLASENIYFEQHFADEEAHITALHPFIRNTVGCMEFGGTFLTDVFRSKVVRRTTINHELAQAVLFQNPIQNFALEPKNLTEAPAEAIEFLKTVPTTWDETLFIDGYPGRYIVLARRNGQRWYVAATNALSQTIDIDLELPAQIPGGRFRARLAPMDGHVEVRC